MAELTATGLSLMKQGIPLLEDISLTLKRGELAVLLGPNGGGKTTLLRCLLALERSSAGEVHFGGRPMAHITPVERARNFAYLPQQRELAWPIRVRDIVALGRFAYGAPPSRLGPADAAAVTGALADCSLTDLADRKSDTLSGGELARVHLARALASEAPFLIADEPVAALDPAHQIRVMDLIRAYVDRGGGALIVVHDLPLAARFADRMLWLKDGRLIADGPPQETLTAARMAEAYGVVSEISFAGGAASIKIRGLTP